MGGKNARFRATVVHEAANVMQARFGRWGVSSAVGADLAWYLLLDSPSAIKEASVHFILQKATSRRSYLSSTLVETGYLYPKVPGIRIFTGAALNSDRLQIFHLEKDTNRDVIHPRRASRWFSAQKTVLRYHSHRCHVAAQHHDKMCCMFSIQASSLPAHEGVSNYNFIRRARTPDVERCRRF